MPTAIKNITLQQDKPSLRVTSNFIWGRDASASAICWFWGPFGPGDVTFQQNFMIFKFSISWSETLGAFKFLTRPMDRAEVLHAPSYDIREGWKIGPGQNELVLPSENSTFQKKMQHNLCLNCNSTCPLPQRILLSKRTSRLYELLLISFGERDASAWAICWF